MTSGPPLVVIPGWRRGRAGLIGIALALVVLLGGAAFGVVNSRGLDDTLEAKQNALLGRSSDGDGSAQQIIGKFPKCASGFPRPSGADPQRGIEQTTGGPCVWTFHVDGKPETVVNFYKAELPKAGMTATVVLQNPQASALAVSGGRCGNISVTNRPDGKGSLVAVATQPCPTGRPTPRPTPTAK